MLGGKDAVVTTMGDVWALGVVLFMLLTGEHPFTPDMSISDEEMAQRVLEVCDGGDGGGCSEATLFTDKRGGDGEEGGEEDGGEEGKSRVSPLARDLIMRMLTPDPELRATTQEVLAHPWLESANAWIGDRTQRTVDPRGHRHRHRRNRHPRYGAPSPTNPETLQKFWSARRRLKAIMLSLMCGLVEVEKDEHDEEERFRALMKVRGEMEERQRKRAAAAAAPQPPSPSPEPPEPPEPAAVLPAELVPDSWFDSPEDKEEKKRAAAAAKAKAKAAAAAAKAAAERKAKAAAAAAAAAEAASYADYIEQSQDEADGAGEDRFNSILTNPRVGVQPYAIGSREAACGMIDQGQKGYITGKDLERITMAMGERLSRAEISDMMRAVDGDPSTESRRVTYGEIVETVPPLSPPKMIKAGQTLYGEGQLDPNFYLLMKGTVEFSVRSLQHTTGLQRQLPGTVLSICTAVLRAVLIAFMNLLLNFLFCRSSLVALRSQVFDGLV